MRVLLAVCASAVLAIGCGDGESLSAPKSIRWCGELEGVEPVEARAIGEDEFGCPMFEPVPCTDPEAMYDLLCGPGCAAATAARSDGDSWFIGCWVVPEAVGIQPLELPPLPPYCFVDPYFDEAFWFFRGEGSIGLSIAVPFLQCWEPCDPLSAEAIAPHCP